MVRWHAQRQASPAHFVLQVISMLQTNPRVDWVAMLAFHCTPQRFHSQRGLLTSPLRIPSYALQVVSIILLIVFFFSHNTLFCISFAAEVLRAYGEQRASCGLQLLF